jgi:glyoxalase family protein
MKAIEGLHHITAVARDAQQNVDFYRNILGQRLVKRTVNFDVPGTYHLYYADAAGTPGSVMTFFAWPETQRAVRGNGAVNAYAYQVPANALGFWQEHLRSSGVQTQAIEQRFGVDVLPFDDPDGLRIELVGSSEQAKFEHWIDGPIGPDVALQGFHSTTLWLDQVEPTAQLLTRHMGYTLSGQEGSRFRFTIGGSGTAGGNTAGGTILDIIERPGGSQAVSGAGSIHHIAFRVPDDPTELEYQLALRAAGFRVSPVRDRSYFHSIYFNEPGGILFEIATQNPGFATDEPKEQLGETLRLPAWLEAQRPEIETKLAPLSLQPVQKVAYELKR